MLKATVSYQVSNKMKIIRYLITPSFQLIFDAQINILINDFY